MFLLFVLHSWFSSHYLTTDFLQNCRSETKEFATDRKMSNTMSSIEWTNQNSIEGENIFFIYTVCIIILFSYSICEIS